MSLDDIKREVIRLAKADPDFVYEAPNPTSGCTYTRNIDGDGEIVGDCLFGQALINLGFDKQILCDADSAMVAGMGSSISEILIKNGVVEGFDNDGLVGKFESVQLAQDRGLKWIRAVQLLLD